MSRECTEYRDPYWNELTGPAGLNPGGFLFWPFVRLATLVGRLCGRPPLSLLSRGRLPLLLPLSILRGHSLVSRGGVHRSGGRVRFIIGRCGADRLPSSARRRSRAGVLTASVAWAGMCSTETQNDCSNSCENDLVSHCASPWFPSFKVKPLPPPLEDLRKQRGEMRVPQLRGLFGCLVRRGFVFKHVAGGWARRSRTLTSGLCRVMDGTLP